MPKNIAAHAPIASRMTITVKTVLYSALPLACSPRNTSILKFMHLSKFAAILSAAGFVTLVICVMISAVETPFSASSTMWYIDGLKVLVHSSRDSSIVFLVSGRMANFANESKDFSNFPLQSSIEVLVDCIFSLLPVNMAQARVSARREWMASMARPASASGMPWLSMVFE